MAKAIKPPLQTAPEIENYFTCNLGQSALYGADVKFSNISEFVRQQAHDHATLPAVGLYTPEDDSSAFDILTFQQIHKRSELFAEILSAQGIPKCQVVALMIRSLPEFLFAFLALIKIGSPVLLIAPQCSPRASAELCKQCSASMLFPSDTASELMQGFEDAASGIGYPLRCHRLASGNDSATPSIFASQGLPDDTAYFFHTSGTSTGIPKPIPQSHRAGAGVQHRFDGTSSATFTTTPLYHGGMADLFRAWTSNALIWLFPGEHLPVTAKNVVKCLEIAQQAATNGGLPPVKYFSSVPYVLQGMHSDQGALKHLVNMDVVGVGGAALPTEVGDDLVRKGVNLISRFGSAECGFLMSSHRDYAKDLEWRYLRPKEGATHLRFEERDGGLHELVVLPSWPFMAKSNQEDGSFATSDLFERHPILENAWRYHSRADSQLTLVTGKKFDPAPVESALATLSPFVSDVLVFGNDRPYPGALIFRSDASAGFSNERLLEELWPAVEKHNAESQPHTRIQRSMVVPMPCKESCLEKSSKGTIIRRKAEERYQQEIQQAYALPAKQCNVLDEDIAEYIHKVVQSTVGSSNHQRDTLEKDTDLFAYGVDSIACIQIRSKLGGLLSSETVRLPPTIVEDSGTIKNLSKAIIGLRHGKHSEDFVEDQLEMMQHLVSEYSVLRKPIANSPVTTSRGSVAEKKTILLTGSTGSLGCNLLFQLLSSADVEHIHLLVRGPNSETSRQRLMEALASRQLGVPPGSNSKVSIHPYDLADERLGLSEDIYTALVREVDIVVHLAWSVNFLMPLRGFRQHFRGLQTLLTLALAHAQYSEDGKGSKIVFCSSTASVASFAEMHSGSRIPEDIVADPRASGPIGYSRSKWVAETICSEVSEQYPELKGCIDVVRVGQVSGHSGSGVWNVSEAYPLLLSTGRLLGCLPELDHENLAWIPVDKAAVAFTQLALGKTQNSASNDPTEAIRVVHLLNPEPKMKWNSFISWIQELDSVDAVPFEKWLHKLERLRSSGLEEEQTHPSLKLLEFWKASYGSAVHRKENVEEQVLGTAEEDVGCEYAMIQSKQAMPVLTSLTTLEKTYAMRLWKWVKDSL